MFFRFASALGLVVAISLVGTALEKRNLELKRVVSRQQYRLEILFEQHAANRVLAHQLGAPNRLIDKIEEEAAPPETASKSAKSPRPAARSARHNAHVRPRESPRPAP
jgi:hypothetical protein